MAATVNPSNQGIAPPPPGVTPNFVDPQVHLLGAVPILIIFNTFATICLALRLFTKIHIMKIVGWEDAAITLAWGCNLTTMVMYFVGIPLHNQAHIWNISLYDFSSYIKPSLAVDLLLAPASGLPKIAILLFYLRINPFRNFQIAVWATIALVWSYMISIFLAVLFSCHPVHKLWDPTVEGDCIKTLPILLAAPAISTLLDLMILALPIPMLIKLRANIQTKLLIAAIFSAFSCTTIISAIRTGLLARLLTSTDITWDAALVGDLTIVESNMMIVCGSVLVLRPFCFRYFPSLLGGERSGPLDEEGKPSVTPNYDPTMPPNSKNGYSPYGPGAKKKKNNSSRRRPRGLWSISFGNTTKDEEEEVDEAKLDRSLDVGDGSSSEGVDKKDAVLTEVEEKVETPESSGDAPLPPLK